MTQYMTRQDFSLSYDQIKPVYDKVNVFKHKDRINIIELILTNPDIQTSRIGEILNIESCVVSTHLTKLFDAQLITKRKEGKAVHHRVAPGYLHIREFFVHYPDETEFKAAKAKHISDKDFKE